MKTTKRKLLTLTYIHIYIYIKTNERDVWCDVLPVTYKQHSHQLILL